MNFIKISAIFIVMLSFNWSHISTMKQNENNSPSQKNRLTLQSLIKIYKPEKQITQCSNYWYVIEIISRYTSKKIALDSEEFTQNSLEVLTSIIIIAHDFGIIDLRNACIDIFIKKIKNFKKESVSSLEEIIKKIPKAIKELCINRSYEEIEVHATWLNTLIMIPNGIEIISVCEKNEIKISNIQTHQTHTLIKGSCPVAITPCGKKIICTYEDTIIQLFDTISKTSSKLETNHSDTISSLALIEYSKKPSMIIIESYIPSYAPQLEKEFTIIATGSCDTKIKIWDFNAKKCLNTLKGHTKSVHVLIALPDKKRILSGSQDTTIKLWNMDSGTCSKTFVGHSDTVTCIAFLPNTMKFVSGSSDQTMRIWDEESGKCLKIIKNFYGTITSIAFALDETYIISGSVEKMIQIWNMESGKCIKEFEGTPSLLYALALSLDGTKIISTSYKSIRIWDISLITLFSK